MYKFERQQNDLLKFREVIGQAKFLVHDYINHVRTVGAYADASTM